MTAPWPTHGQEPWGDVLKAYVDEIAITIPTIIAGNYTKRLSNYANLAAAIADLPDGGANGGEIQIDGEIALTASYVVPPNIHLVGRGPGATALLSPSSVGFPMLTLDSASGAIIADLAIRNETGTNAENNGQGILIIGDSDDITLDRVLVEHFRSNIWVQGTVNDAARPHPASPGWVRNLRLNGVRADHSTDIYGICLEYVDGATLNGCTANFNWHDGLKLRSRCKNVVDLGGSYCDNGQAAPTFNGDGVDAFNGAEQVRFISTTADRNHGHGIIAKTDTGTGAGETPGVPKDIEFIGVSCKENDAHGLAVYTFPRDSTTVTDLSQVIVNGGQFIGNLADGIYNDARNVAITGPMVRGNGRHGIWMDRNARYMTIANPMIAGNGYMKNSDGGSYNGTAYGVLISGKHASVRGGTLLGVDGDIDNESDLTSLTKWADFNILCDSYSDDVYLDPDFMGYHSGVGDGIFIQKATGTLIVHHRSTKSSPGAAYATGSVGSTWTKTDAPYQYELRYVKRSGAPNVYNAGWEREGTPPKTAALPTASAGYKGSVMVKDRTLSSGVNDELWVCLEKTAGVYTWVNLG